MLPLLLVLYIVCLVYITCFVYVYNFVIVLPVISDVDFLFSFLFALSSCWSRDIDSYNCWKLTSLKRRLSTTSASQCWDLPAHFIGSKLQVGLHLTIVFRHLLYGCTYGYRYCCSISTKLLSIQRYSIVRLFSVSNSQDLWYMCSCLIWRVYDWRSFQIELFQVATASHMGL